MSLLELEPYRTPTDIGVTPPKVIRAGWGGRDCDKGTKPVNIILHRTPWKTVVLVQAGEPIATSMCLASQFFVDVETHDATSGREGSTFQGSVTWGIIPEYRGLPYPNRPERATRELDDP